MSRKLVRHKILAAVIVLVLVSITGAAAAAGVDPRSAADRSATFTADITNPYFPLVPGRTLVYRGVKDGEAARDELETTDEVVEIDGKPCRLVLDRLYLDGKLAETTADYYTQDSRGRVHYYGEDTATIDAAGHMEPFGTDGTWHAAEFGAVPGIFMPSRLRVGATFQQEFLEGHAEDQFQILDLHTSVSVPYGSFDDALQTKEWTPLEPDVVDHKFFVAGIGVVREVAVQGATEELNLVEIRS